MLVWTFCTTYSSANSSEPEYRPKPPALPQQPFPSFLINSLRSFTPAGAGPTLLSCFWLQETVIDVLLNIKNCPGSQGWRTVSDARRFVRVRLSPLRLTLAGLLFTAVMVGGLLGSFCHTGAAEFHCRPRNEICACFRQVKRQRMPLTGLTTVLCTTESEKPTK